MGDPDQAEHISVSAHDSISLTSPPIAGAWVGKGTTSLVPPTDYWLHLAGDLPGQQLDRLRELSDARQAEFTSGSLPHPESTAIMLLDRVTSDGWLERIQRQTCPNCSEEITPEQAADPICPACNEAYGQHGGVTTQTIYTRMLAPNRNVEWVVAIHGMNTAGEWQEMFSWLLATTWGKSVPVAVYKYGIVVAGVIMAFRRRSILNGLRAKLAALHDEAQSQGFYGRPDVIAHSFGTWLFGHLLQAELAREPADRLRFGRIILTGCILRPDFNWQKLKDAELVEDVLNHYGTADAVVPLAHMTIANSGPSGQRGFDGGQVINLRAEGFGHSDLFSVEKCVANNKCFQPCAGTTGETSHLERSYKLYWRPFLTLPADELTGLPDRANPGAAWHQLWWPLRGTMFPIFALPLILSLITLVLAGLGRMLWDFRNLPVIVAATGATGLVLLFAAVRTTIFWRRRHE